MWQAENVGLEGVIGWPARSESEPTCGGSHIAAVAEETSASFPRFQRELAFCNGPLERQVPHVWAFRGPTRISIKYNKHCANIYTRFSAALALSMIPLCQRSCRRSRLLGRGCERGFRSAKRHIFRGCFSPTYRQLQCLALGFAE